MKIASKIVLFILFFYGSVSAQNFEYVWQTGDGSSAQDETFSVLTDATGNIFVVGRYQDTVDLDNGPGTCILWPTAPDDEGTYLMKTDSIGNFIWAKKLPRLFYSGFTIDGEGNFLLTGLYVNAYQDVDPAPTSVFYLDPPLSCGWMSSVGGYFVLKLDNAGNFVWADSFRGHCGYDPNTTGIVTDALTDIYVTGYFYDTMDFDPGSDTLYLYAHYAVLPERPDAFIQKLDMYGNLVWIKQLEGLGQETTYAINLDASGNVIVGGMFQDEVDFDPGAGTVLKGNAGGIDANMFMLKLDATGNYADVKTFVHPYDQLITDMAIDLSGGILVTGIIEDSVDLDAGPGVYWTPAIDSGKTDVFVAKYDSAFSFIWAKRFGPIADGEITRLDLDQQGNVYTVGSYAWHTTADLDPGILVDTFTVNSLGTFIQKLDTGGNFVWARSVNAQSFDNIHVDDFDHVFLCGIFHDSVDFDPNAGVHALTGYYDAYILKLGQHGTVTLNLNDNPVENNMTVFPNPFNSMFTISTKRIAQKISVTDIFGRTIKTVQPNSNQTTMDLQNAEGGIYFVNVYDGNTRQTVKVIKQ